MKYIAAYMLLTLGGNASPKAEDIKNLLSTVGIDAEESRLSSIVSELEGKDITQLISEGNAKLASVPSGGGSSAAPAAAAASGGAAAAADAPAEKEAEKEEEESDGDLGFGLFD